MHRMEFSMFVAHGANLYIGSSTWREMHVLCTCSSDKHSDGMIDMATCLHLLFFSWEKGRENVGEKWIDVTYKWRLVIGFSKEWFWGWGWITLVCCCCHRESGEHVMWYCIIIQSYLSSTFFIWSSHRFWLMIGSKFLMVFHESIVPSLGSIRDFMCGGDE